MLNSWNTINPNFIQICVCCNNTLWVESVRDNGPPERWAPFLSAPLRSHALCSGHSFSTSPQALFSYDVVINSVLVFETMPKSNPDRKQTPGHIHSGLWRTETLVTLIENLRGHGLNSVTLSAAAPAPSHKENQAFLSNPYRFSKQTVTYCINAHAHAHTHT